MKYVLSEKVLKRMKVKRQDQFHELMYLGVIFLLFLILALLGFIFFMVWAKILIYK